MFGMFSVAYGNSVFSSFSAMGIEVIWISSLYQYFSLYLVGMGMIVSYFQRWAIVLVLRAMLYMFKMYLMASGPRCLKCLIFMPSSSVEFFVLFEMANYICKVVSCIFLVGKVLILWSMCLLILFVLYGVTFVNCLFKAVALSMSVMTVLIPKQMLLFCCEVFFLLDSFAMMPHRECGLCW